MRKYCFVLLAALIIYGCESPRKVYPDYDFGVVIDSVINDGGPEIKLYSTDKEKEEFLFIPGDRVVAAQPPVKIFVRHGEEPLHEFDFHIKDTEKLILKDSTMNKEGITIFSVTDHYNLINKKDKAEMVRTKSVFKTIEDSVITLNHIEN